MSIYDLLAELRASSEQGVGTEYGTGKQIGPSGSRPFWLVVLVTAIAGTLTINLQDSDDNSTYYDITGTSMLDPSDGAVFNATGRFYIPFVTARDYVRTKAVCASDVATWRAFVTHEPPV